MPIGTIEHANITVSEPKRNVDLFTQLLGWHVRWEGQSKSGGDTVHVGNDDTYLAIYTDDLASGKVPDSGYAKGRPLNHIALLVDDLDAAEQVVKSCDLVPFGHDDYDPGKRFYFFDWDGIEFEVVSYAGDA